MMFEAGPDRRVVLEGERLRLERREGEGWHVELDEPFPLPPWRTRELARLIVPAGGPIPVRPLRDADGVRAMLKQLVGSAATPRSTTPSGLWQQLTPKPSRGERPPSGPLA